MNANMYIGALDSYYTIARIYKPSRLCVFEGFAHLRKSYLFDGSAVISLLKGKYSRTLLAHLLC